MRKGKLWAQPKNAHETYLDRSWLEERIHHDKLSNREIGILAGVSRWTIAEWIRRFGITKPDPVKTKKPERPSMTAYDLWVLRMRKREKELSGDVLALWLKENLELTPITERFKKTLKLLFGVGGDFRFARELAESGELGVGSLAGVQYIKKCALRALLEFIPEELKALPEFKAL